MFKVLGISVLFAVVGGLLIGLLGKFFVMSITTVMVLATIASLGIAFGYTFPALKHVLSIGSSSTGGSTKVS